MAIFGPKPSAPFFSPLEKWQFFDFLNLERRFLFQNIVKHIFLAYIAQKKKGEKMAIFGPKPLVNPFRKMAIF